MAEAANANVVISAVDKATEVIRGITGQFDSLQSKWATVASVLGVGGSVAALTSIVKGAIEAGDRMGELSTITGVSVETLSRLQVAAKTSGIDIETLASTLGKMSKNLTGVEDPGSNAARALEALGINAEKFKNAKVEDRLFLLADALEGVDNTTGDATAAMDMLVKGGSALLPMLTGGSEGLREMMATADALGMTLTEETAAGMDKVADTITMLGMQSQGVGNKIATALLPTLEGMSKLWLDNAKAGGGFTDTLAKMVEWGFKGVVTAAMTAYTALKQMGIGLASVAAAATELAQGNFKNAWEEIKRGYAEAGKAAEDNREAITQLWTDTLPKWTEAELKVAKSIDVKTAAQVKASEKAQKAAKDAEELRVKLLDQVAALDRNTAGTAKLSDAQKLMLDIGIALRDNKLRLSEAEKIELFTRLQLIDATVTMRDATEEFYKSQAKSRDEFLKSTASIADNAKQLEQEARMLGLTADQQAKLAAAMRDTEIARLKTLQTTDMVLLAGDQERADIQARIEALERLRNAEMNLASKGALIDAAKKTQEEWKKTAEQIEQALTDAMVKGFTEGKSVVKSVGEWIKNYFLTSIARSIAQSIAGALAVGFSGLANAAGLGGLFGGGAGGAGGGASGGGLGTLTNLASLGGSLFGAGGLGGALAAGAGWLTGATTLTGALTAAGSLIGTGTAGGIAAGLGMGAGALGPIALGAYALYEIFGKRNKSSPAQQNYTAIGSTDFGYSGSAPNLQSTTAYQSVLEPIVTNVAALVARLGGTVGNTSYGIYTSASPDGKGATVQVNAAGSTGELFKAWSNAANETMQQRVEAALPGLLAAGLKDANLPEEIAAIFRELDPNTATIAQIDAAIEKALALAPQQEEADQAQIDTYEAVQANSEVLLRQADLLDKLNTAVERLAQIAESGLNATAAASADAGREVVRAVLTLAPAEVNGGAL